MHTALLSLDTTHALALLLISFAAGIGISAVGPGGVLMTIGLVAFTLMSPSRVAGTAIVTHVATGLVGTMAYWRPGQLGHRATRREIGRESRGGRLCQDEYIPVVADPLKQQT